MGKILDRLISWFLSALTIVFLLVLSILGWYNYLFGGIFLVVGTVLTYFSIRALAECMRGRVAVSNPFEQPLTSKKQTAISIMLLLVAILFLALGILVLAGYIDLTKRVR